MTNMGIVYFDDESLNWLICIRFLRESGMSLSDIKHYFELCLAGSKTLPERYEILEALLEQSKRELEMIQKTYKMYPVKSDSM